MPKDGGPKIRRVSLDSLKPDEGNTRRRKDRGKRALEQSLKRFGPGRSIVLDGGDVVRAGNGTLEAARRAGITDVIVVEPEPGTIVAVKRSDWSPTEAKAYSIADNRTNDLSEFDPKAMAAAVDELVGEGFEVDLLELDTKRPAAGLSSADLKEWDASELRLDALFTFRAPIELQAKIRKLLREQFPDARFEEETVYG